MSQLGMQEKASSHVKNYMKNMTQNGCWGFSHNPIGKLDDILILSDHEVIFVVGSRLVILDYAARSKSKIMYLGPTEVTEVLLLSLSTDLKYVAASIKVESGKATMLIHQIEAHGVSQFRTPRLITNDASESYLGISFSANSSLIAAFTNSQSVGILIYDRILQVQIKSVNVGSLVTNVSFNPDDSSRICTSGALLQFWRCTDKVVHNAPITGLPRCKSSFTCHIWLPDRRVVVGTDSGELVVVFQSSVQSVHSAFGGGANESHSSRRDDKVVAIFAVENTVVAVSPVSTVAVFEVVRLAPSSSAVGSITVQKALILKARFRLGPCDSPLKGVQLGIPRKLQLGPILLVTTQTALTSYNLSDNHESMGGELSVPSLDPCTDPIEIEPILQNLLGTVIYKFHGSHIDHLCLSNHSSVLTTLSKKDRSVRVWDGSSPFYSPDAVEDYSERCDDTPTVIDLHPSGWTMACAMKDGTVSEFGITFSGLSFIRLIVDARIPFVSSDGTSYATTSPVSLLKYAHGGHLLAVVCGKLIQIFHIFSLDYSASDFSGSTQGKPCRLMTIASHSSAISDLTFSADDSLVYSCSFDGTVYSHAVSATPASEPVSCSGSYFSRGNNALSIAVNSNRVLIVCYDSSEGQIISGSHVAVWSSGIVTDSPSLIHIDKAVTHISIGRIHSISLDSYAADVCVMGCADGSILVTSLPFPTLLRPLGTTDAHTVGSAASLTLGEGEGSVQVVDDFRSRSDSVTDGRQLRFGSICTSAAVEDSHLSCLVSVPFLDITQCKVFNMHCGPVSSVLMTADGNRIFSTGHDGSIFELSVTAPSRAVLSVGVEEDQSSTVSLDAVREYLSESALMLSSRRDFEKLHSHATQLELSMQDRLRESENAMAKLSVQAKVRLTALEAKLKWEVSKRDAVILSEREDHEQLVLKLRGELSSFEKRQSDAISRVEVEYEKKLAQEAVYLERLRQAYDELALNTRLDKARTEAGTEETLMNTGIHTIDRVGAVFTGKLDEAKQKEALLTYVGYVSARHDEILSALERDQEKERIQLKTAAAVLSLQLEEAKLLESKKETATNRRASQLSAEVAMREDHLLRLQNDLDWSQGRVERLEIALQQATAELTSRAERYEKSEVRSSDQMQQIFETERVREALSIQIKGLKQEVEPKNEQLQIMAQKLLETERECETSHKALSDKESLLALKTATTLMLQKQVRDLRNRYTSKDSALQRAAVLLEQYQQMLQAADISAAAAQSINIRNSRAKASLTNKSALLSLSSTGPVDPLGASKGSTQRLLGASLKTMPSTALQSAKEVTLKKSNHSIALLRLSEVLRPHLTATASANHASEIDYDMRDDGSESISAHLEKEKQIKYLHMNVNALKGNLEKVQLVSDIKAKNLLSDNEQLLREVSEMRQEIRQLSMDNQRLNADLQGTLRKQFRAKAREKERDTASRGPPRTDHSLSLSTGEGIVRQEEWLDGWYADGDSRSDSLDYLETEATVPDPPPDIHSQQEIDVSLEKGHGQGQGQGQGGGQGRKNRPTKVLQVPLSVLEHQYSEQISADLRHSGLKALNEAESSTLKLTSNKKVHGDSNIQAVSAQDIVNFHKQLVEKRGTLDSISAPASSKPYQGGLSAAEGTSKATAPLRLRTTSIQLPDVMK